MGKFKEIKFKGRRYIFTGDNFDEDGAIATKHQYKNGLCSFAHYYPGEERGIYRFGDKIGERKDIKILGEVEVKVNFAEAILNVGGSSWPK